MRSADDGAMTTAPDPDLQARAAKSAAEIARRWVEWICEGEHKAQIDGPIYRHSESIAAPIILEVLQEQDQATRERVWVVPPLGRPADKIIAGLNEAVSATQLAGKILDLLPRGVVTKDLHSRIIATLAQEAGR